MTTASRFGPNRETRNIRFACILLGRGRLRLRRHRPKFGPTRAELGRHRPEVGRSRPRIWPKQVSVDAGQATAEIKQSSAEIEKNWSDTVQVCPKSDQTGQMSIERAKIWTRSTKKWRKSGQSRPKSHKFDRDRAKFGGSRPSSRRDRTRDGIRPTTFAGASADEGRAPRCAILVGNWVRLGGQTQWQPSLCCPRSRHCWGRRYYFFSY